MSVVGRSVAPTDMIAVDETSAAEIDQNALSRNKLVPNLTCFGISSEGVRCTAFVSFRQVLPNHSWYVQMHVGRLRLRALGVTWMKRSCETHQSHVGKS